MVVTIQSNSNVSIYIDRDRESKDFLIECRNRYLGKKDPISVAKTTEGAPYYSDHSCFVSLSHKDGLYVAALSINPVGVDVERVKPIDYNKIGERYFDRHFDSPLDFFRYWTSREALAKLHGKGLFPITEYAGSVVYHYYGEYIIAVATN